MSDGDISAEFDSALRGDQQGAGGCDLMLAAAAGRSLEFR